MVSQIFKLKGPIWEDVCTNHKNRTSVFKKISPSFRLWRLNFGKTHFLLEAIFDNVLESFRVSLLFTLKRFPVTKYLVKISIKDSRLGILIRFRLILWLWIDMFSQEVLLDKKGKVSNSKNTFFKTRNSNTITLSLLFHIKLENEVLENKQVGYWRHCIIRGHSFSLYAKSVRVRIRG